MLQFLVKVQMISTHEFLKKKAKFKTKLIRKGAAPGGWTELRLPQGAKEVLYQSNCLDLKAYILFPWNKMDYHNPAVVLFHGGTRLNREFLDEVSPPFLDAGFIVMLPTLRGENGNQGDHELFLGEVDDAAEAVKWLSRQSYVGKEQIYTFGYSMGGEISALLSLYEDLPMHFGGSCGAFFGRTNMFGAESMFNSPVPFDINNEKEKELRTLAGNVMNMNYKHYAFIGKDDDKFKAKAYKEINTENTKLEIIEVKGDHDTSLEFALKEFLKIIAHSIHLD